MGPTCTLQRCFHHAVARAHCFDHFSASNVHTDMPVVPDGETGHIGVYIGNGEVVEAMGTRYGVVKTKLEGARWTHWLKIPYISYD